MVVNQYCNDLLFYRHLSDLIIFVGLSDRSLIHLNKSLVNQKNHSKKYYF